MSHALPAKVHYFKCVQRKQRRILQTCVLSLGFTFVLSGLVVNGKVDDCGGAGGGCRRGLAARLGHHGNIQVLRQADAHH